MKQEHDLKSIPRLLVNSFYWITLFLVLPTVTSYFVDWKILVISRDVGIIILFVALWFVKYRMNKKAKEEGDE